MTPLNQRPWIVWTVLVVAGVVVGISIFIMIIGVPYSYVSVTETCAIGNPCVQTTQSGTYLDPTPVTIIPLLLGAVVALGVFKQWAAISWAGMTGLLFFSFVSIFSIGLLFLPFAIALFGLLAVVRIGRALKQEVPRSLTPS